MTPEELAEIRAKLPVALASSSRALMLCREHLPGLLELVDGLQDENLSLQIGKDAALEAYTTLYADYQRLQEQVRELQSYKPGFGESA